MLDIIEKFIRDKELSAESYDLVLAYVSKILYTYTARKVSARDVTNQFLYNLIKSNRSGGYYHKHQRLKYFRLNVYTAFNMVIDDTPYIQLEEHLSKLYYDPVYFDLINDYISEALDEEEEKYIRRRFLEGYSTKDIAEKVGDKQQYIIDVITRAKRKLKYFITNITTEYAPN